MKALVLKIKKKVMCRTSYIIIILSIINLKALGLKKKVWQKTIFCLQTDNIQQLETSEKYLLCCSGYLDNCVALEN
jgi:hypothetical protein